MSSSASDSASSDCWNEGESRPVAPATTCEISEIVGHESQRNTRMGLGPLLALADLAAGRCSALFCQSGVATIAFDNVLVRSAVRHGELVQFKATLQSVGRSSMRVRVTAQRHLRRKRYVPLLELYVTMVAITSSGRPNRRIPALRPEDTVLAHAANVRRTSPAGADDLSIDLLEDVADDEREEVITPAESELVLRKMFLPRHLNINDTIFGGDLLLWMDRHATYVARSFAGTDQVVTLALHAVEFRLPITTRDFVEMVGRVEYVKGDDVLVQIDVSIERHSGEKVRSHTASFVLRVYDEYGLRVGLRHDGMDKVQRARFATSQAQYREFVSEFGENALRLRSSR